MSSFSRRFLRCSLRYVDDVYRLIDAVDVQVTLILMLPVCKKGLNVMTVEGSNYRLQSWLISFTLIIYIRQSPLTKKINPVRTLKFKKIHLKIVYFVYTMKLN